MRRHVRQALSALLAVAMAATIVGCNGGGAKNLTIPPITVSQADDQIERHLQAAGRSIPGARLERATAYRVADCTAPEDGGPPGRLSATTAYWIRDLPVERNQEIYDAGTAYWRDRGFRIVADRRPHDEFISAEAPGPDWTVMSIQTSVEGSRTVSINASSPCVWRDGTPPPNGTG